MEEHNGIADVFGTEDIGSLRTVADPTDRTALEEDDLSSHSTGSLDATARPLRPLSGQSSQQRSKRVPIGKQSRIKFEREPGYAYRMVNDSKDGSNIQRFLLAGWKIVQRPHAKGGDDRAGVDSQMGAPVERSVGGGMKGVLMRIDQEKYDEDFAAKMADIDNAENGLRRRDNGIRNGVYGAVEIGEQTNPHL